MSWYYPDFDLKIDVYKDFDTKIDTDVKADYELDVDVYKDIDVYLDIDTDIKIEDNSAVTTGLAENDSTKYLMDVTSSTYTDDWNSNVTSTVDVVQLTGTSGTPHALGDFTTQAYGEDTYAELDLQVHVTDFSTVISWIGESAED